MTDDKLPPAPTGSQAPGRRLWRSVVQKYKLDEHETALLTEAVRTVDVLAELDVAVRRDGVTVETPQGLRLTPQWWRLEVSGWCWRGCWQRCACPKRNRQRDVLNVAVALAGPTASRRWADGDTNRYRRREQC